MSLKLNYKITNIFKILNILSKKYYSIIKYLKNNYFNFKIINKTFNIQIFKNVNDSKGESRSHKKTISGNK